MFRTFICKSNRVKSGLFKFFIQRNLQNKPDFTKVSKHALLLTVFTMEKIFLEQIQCCPRIL